MSGDQRISEKEASELRKLIEEEDIRLLRAHSVYVQNQVSQQVVLDGFGSIGDTAFVLPTQFVEFDLID